MVAAKPLHSSSVPLRNVSRSSTTLRARSSTFKSPAPTTTKTREQLLLSDLSNPDDPPTPRTVTPPSPPASVPPPPPPPRVQSSASVRSTIKLQNQVPRCRSAMSEVRDALSSSKAELKFLIITDPEHRIESWYHHYPFIAADDLLEVFRSKSNVTNVPAYFVDPTPSPPVCHSSSSTKSYLQGKPFHLQLDWKKFDLILISDQIYESIFSHLQSIVTLIRKSGQIIRIQQINHQQDLKTQIRAICRQVPQ